MLQFERVVDYMLLFLKIQNMYLVVPSNSKSIDAEHVLHFYDIYCYFQMNCTFAIKVAFQSSASFW